MTMTKLDGCSGRRMLGGRSLASLAAVALAAGIAVSAAPRPAEAFCGFYVAGADAKLFNNATMVVLMREGTRTVLSMQNNYQGPPENFAMIVPVPVVLQKENVKTLPREIFDHVDKLAAPRLVEYWEQDPCYEPSADAFADMAARPTSAAAPRGGGAKDLGVKIEAQFTVGEYEIVILSANDSLGLDTWLRQGGYKIPEGAEPLLRPYVQGGSKFFVAKVDSTKVRFENGMAMLSPLRFHYDADTFNLPVRLGLVNSAGTQDLIVHILARGQRYELANYKNVTIPTNLDVDEKARDQFGAFYAALFDRTIEENPGAIVTEYAWDASTCDPCPSPTLTPQEIATLGGDVLPGSDDATPRAPSAPGARPWGGGSGFVLTRLHARYGRDALGEDLVFRAAPPIAGGREWKGKDGKLEVGSQQGSGVNNFQGRYAIRHPWKGAIKCENPRRGIWGGPPRGEQGDTQAKPAQNLAFAPRGGVKLAAFLKHDVPEIKAKAAEPTVPSAGATPTSGSASKSCGACRVGEAGSTGGSDLSMWASLALGVSAAVTRIAARRRRWEI
jgi:hypothetical protein